jgi:hypothetical protein
LLVGTYRKVVKLPLGLTGPVVRRSACGTVAVLNQQSAAGVQQCRIWEGKAQKRRTVVHHNRLTAQVPDADGLLRGTSPRRNSADPHQQPGGRQRRHREGERGEMDPVGTSLVPSLFGRIWSGYKLETNPMHENAGLPRLRLIRSREVPAMPRYVVTMMRRW